jgi:hypothetical protein
MRGSRALLLGLFGLAVAAPASADPSTAHALIHDCMQHVSQDLQGNKGLRDGCPGLDEAVEDLGLGALLPDDWRHRVSPRVLSDWDTLSIRYTQAAPRALPSPSRLQAIAQVLQPLPSLSWWDRFKAWLENWLDNEPGRWTSWLKLLPNWRLAGKVFVYTSIALVLIGAVAVVIVELRAAGLLGSEPRPRRHRKHPATRAPTVAGHRWSLDELDEAAAHLRPMVALRLLVHALTESRRLEHERDLTCRELITTARFDTTAQREIFSSVALVAEQALYGDPEHTPPAPMDAVLSNARGLYSELLATVAGQPSK